MGLISKHGILIVQFANDLQAEGRSKREAIEQAAAIRLRPILMTTAAMVLGVVPLITAGGAGAVSRFQMGLVIASGLSIGTLFTLFVVPAVYMLLAADRRYAVALAAKAAVAAARSSRRITSFAARRAKRNARWKIGAHGSISNSKTNAPGRRAICWRRCRCNGRGWWSISAAGRATRPSFSLSAFRNPR